MRLKKLSKNRMLILLCISPQTIQFFLAKNKRKLNDMLIQKRVSLVREP